MRYKRVDVSARLPEFRAYPEYRVMKETLGVWPWWVGRDPREVFAVQDHFHSALWDPLRDSFGNALESFSDNCRIILRTLGGIPLGTLWPHFQILLVRLPECFSMPRVYIPLPRFSKMSHEFRNRILKNPGRRHRPYGHTIYRAAPHRTVPYRTVPYIPYRICYI